MPPRVDLHGEEFDELINQKGIECEYQPAIVCECITADSNQPLFSCPLCGGSGYRYLPKKDVRVVVTSFASKTQSEIIGLRESGTAYATPPSDTIMGFHDRLTFPKFECKYSERLWIKRGQQVSSKTYRNIKRVDTLVIGNSEFEFEKDYIISEDRHHIVFLKPIHELLDMYSYEDVPVSILYYTTPAYLVVDLLHELRASYTTRLVTNEKFFELPKQYMIRREDFVYPVGKTIDQSTVKESDSQNTEHVSTGLFD